MWFCEILSRRYRASLHENFNSEGLYGSCGRQDLQEVV